MKRYTKWLFWLVVMAGIAGAQEAPERGAKELFFDPGGRSELVAVNVNERAAEKKEEVEIERQRSQSERVREAPLVRRAVLPATETTNNLGLSYWIELVEESGATGVQVTESRAFRSGEKIRLHFESNRAGAISLLQLGTSGIPRMLFPDRSKGLVDNVLRAGEPRILPTPDAWFRFDGEPGTERLIVVFAADGGQLEETLYRDRRDFEPDPGLVQTASLARGSKDLVLETEDDLAAEIGTYAVSLGGQPIVLEIVLEHR